MKGATMNPHPQEPNPVDAVLGTGAIATPGSAILGGLDGVKQRLVQGTLEQQLIALKQAIDYGETGVDVAIAALAHESLEMRYTAYQLLKNSSTESAKRFLETVLPFFEFESATINGDLSITRHKGCAQYFSEELGDGITLEMVSIPGGTFMMGSPKDKEGRSSQEGPQHRVAVPGFFMGKYPVTQAQWRAVAALPKVKLNLKHGPFEFEGDNRPDEWVSWYDAVEFCDRLSQHTGRQYRLPSEAEWEYACRAGTTTPFHFGETITTDLANYRGTDGQLGWSGSYGRGPEGKYRRETTPVDQFGIANAFGLCDMHGNVGEWCQDHWHENYGEALGFCDVYGNV
jgi:formylglycine-generating enzyme required for sulfatase activity